MLYWNNWRFSIIVRNLERRAIERVRKAHCDGKKKFHEHESRQWTKRMIQVRRTALIEGIGKRSLYEKLSGILRRKDFRMVQLAIPISNDINSSYERQWRSTTKQMIQRISQSFDKSVHPRNGKVKVKERHKKGKKKSEIVSSRCGIRTW